MKYSKSETYSKVHALPNIDFEDQRLTSFAGLVIIQKFFTTIELKKKLHSCLTHLNHGKIINRTTLFMQLIVHLLLGFRELNDCHFYRDDPLVKRLLGLKRIPNAATLSRFLKDATAQSVESLRRCLRDMVLSPNGEVMYLACGSPYYIQIIDTDSITAAGKMDTGRGPSAVAVTPDGSIVLGGTTSSDDFYLHSFDSATFLKMDEFETTDETWRVAINADGEFILAFTGDTYYDRYYLDIYAHVYAQPPEGTIIEPLPNSVLSTADVPICLQLEDPDGVNSSSITISVDAVDLDGVGIAGPLNFHQVGSSVHVGS